MPMFSSERWGSGTAGSFTSLVTALHGLLQRTVSSKSEARALFQRLAGMLERDPALARLLGKRDMTTMLSLLETDPASWVWLGPAVAGVLKAEGDAGERLSWLSEENIALLARSAANSLLQGPSPYLSADLYLLQECVTQPGVDDVVVVVNATRLLIKQQEETGWTDNGAPLRASLELLHVWRRPLIMTLPGWSDSLQRWCLRLAHQPGALTMLDPTLKLFKDYLQEAPPQDATPWLDTLLAVMAEVYGAWKWAASPAMLVTLSSSTIALTTAMQALLQVSGTLLNPSQLQAVLKQLLTFLDERGHPETCQLPGDTLHTVTVCVCRLMDFSSPSLLLWTADTFATPARVLQAVEKSPDGGGDRDVVAEEARIVTGLLRVLSPFSFRVLLLALRKLQDAGGEVLFVGVLSEWFSSVVASGLRLDPSICLLPPMGTPLLQVVSKYFCRRHDPALLQIMAFALMGGDTNNDEAKCLGETLARELTVVAEPAVRGVCTLLAFLCCPQHVFLQALKALPPGQAAADVVSCQHSSTAAGLHPKYRELLSALAKQVAPLLYGTTDHVGIITCTQPPQFYEQADAPTGL